MSDPNLIDRLARETIPTEISMIVCPDCGDKRCPGRKKEEPCRSPRTAVLHRRLEET